MTLVLTALAWLSMTMHCRLEAIPGFHFLPCASENNCHDSQDSDSSDSQCCSVEKSQYRGGQSRLTIPLPALLPVSFVSPIAVVETHPEDINLEIRSAPPPEL